MDGDVRKGVGGGLEREEREERVEQGNEALPERKRRLRDENDERLRGDEMRQKEGGVEYRSESSRWEHRRGHHRGGSRNRDYRERGNRDSKSGYDSLASTDKKKKRIEDKEKQPCTIFVGDLDPDTTAEQLTELFKKFGSVEKSKIKENHCYGFVTFDKRLSAEAAIAVGQTPDGIELLNGKQVYVSWALGSLPEWKKGIGGFTISPGKDLLSGHRSRKGVVKPSVLAAATAAAAAKAHAVLAGEMAQPMESIVGDYRGRAIVAYDDLL